MQEHRAILGLANPTDKISELKKDKGRYYRLVLRYFVFLDRELECNAGPGFDAGREPQSACRGAVLLAKHAAIKLAANDTHYALAA
jgi:hypothetical protein